MKTTFLFAAIILMSTASFAQSSANVDANAQATIKTNSISKTTGKAEQGTKKAVSAANSEKKALMEQSKSEVKNAKRASEQDAKVSASSQAEASSNTSASSNNSGKSTSLNGKASASNSTSADVNIRKMKEDGIAAEHKTANTLVKTDEGAKATVKSTDAKVEAKGKEVKQAVKPKPAAVKVNTHIATATGIKIK